MPRIGIFIRCTPAEKQRIVRAAKVSRRTLSDYILVAVLRQVERDEVLRSQERRN